MLYIPQSMKQCKVCEEWHPATKYYFNHTDIRLRDCIKCHNIRQRELRLYRQSKKASPSSGILYRPQSMKRCTKCGEWKLASALAFRVDDGAIGTICRECDRKWHQNYRQDNKELFIQRSRTKRQKHAASLKVRAQKKYAENKERYSQKSHEYYLRNRDQILYRVRGYGRLHGDEIRGRKIKAWHSNRDRHRAEKAKYYKENKSEITQRQKAYRLTEHGKRMTQAVKARHLYRKRTLINTFTGKQWLAALDYFDNKCAVCGRDLNGLFHTASMDHWIPLKSPDCPGTIATNIVPLCHAIKGGEGGCNNSKNFTDAYTWLVRKFGKSKADTIMKRIEAYFEWVRAHETEDQHSD